jgi:hypothetical protein
MIMVEVHMMCLVDYGSIYVIPMVDIMVYDDTCYAFTVELEYLWFVILWRCFYDKYYGFYF